MKRFLLLLFFGVSITFHAKAQQISLKKGIIIDSIQVSDSIPENFALYLPTNFEMNVKWPVVFVFDLDGKGKRTLRMLKNAAEQQGYIMAASNNINDSLSLSQNILISNRMFNKVFDLFPVHNNRVYTAGFSNGGRLASLIPSFVKGIDGVISCGTAIPNTELLSAKNPFHFIGIVGKEDFNYIEMLEVEKTLNKIKFPNHLLVFSDEQPLAKQKYLQKAMEIFTIESMGNGNVRRNDSLIETSYKSNIDEINSLIDSNKLIRADDLLGEMISIYRSHMDVDSLKDRKRVLKKDKRYRALKRNENNFFFKESLIKADYIYYLEEDVLNYNFNNLGWWNYQMEELKKHINSKNKAEQQMGKRLRGYVNALIEDDVEVLESEKQVDEEALSFLWMLKTIANPKDYIYYLKVISNSAKNEDFGAALFYLGELLENGYTDRAELYALEHTALLRITPEFNEIVAKHLKEARYDIIEE